jgi:hypothetical protein
MWERERYIRIQIRSTLDKQVKHITSKRARSIKVKGRIRIRIRIRVKGKLRILIRMRIKLKGRIWIRIRIKLMRLGDSVYALTDVG